MSASQPAKTNRVLILHPIPSLLPVNLQTAYRTVAGHNSVCHLSELCANLELLEKDEVILPVPDYPEGRRLSEVGVRRASAATAKLLMLQTRAALKTLTRQHFVLEETVSLVFGLYKKIVGTLTWDDSVLSSLFWRRFTSRSAI